MLKASILNPLLRLARLQTVWCALLIFNLIGLSLLSPAPSVKAADQNTTVPGKVITSYNWGEIPESIAFDQAGNLYVTLSLSGQLRKITLDGTQTLLATFPVGTGGIGQQPGILGTLAIDGDNTIYLTLSSSEANANGIWRVNQQGVAQRLVALPVGAMPNGITLDYFGNLYVADSALGQIWRVKKGESVAQVWLKDALLAPQGGAGFPGANGIKFYLNGLYVSNSSSGNIIRVNLQLNGQPGVPMVYASGVNADDFAFDLVGDLYASTHPFNTIVRIRPNGSQEIIATPAQNVIGPTSAAFGSVGSDRFNLYVVTDGGFFGSLINPGGPTGLPSVVKLQLGLPGWPLV
jgi:sugar lactone lactonase YvrE